MRRRRNLDHHIYRTALWALPLLVLLSIHVIGSRPPETGAVIAAAASASRGAAAAAAGVDVAALRDLCRTVPSVRTGLSPETLAAAGAVLQSEAEAVAHADYLVCLASYSQKRLCQPQGIRDLITDLEGYHAPRRAHAQALAALVRAGTAPSGHTRTAEIVAEADTRIARALDKLVGDGFVRVSDLRGAGLPQSVTDRIDARDARERPCP